ncbi:MAG TPA: hypothetical protein VKZ49_04465 [Polyangiaceae bacterium]|nr:hypothetical protein [Polyangiaceae bacterium]
MRPCAGLELLAPLLLLVVTGCVREPPPSQFPSARAAIERMRESHACSRGVQGEAKIDYFGDGGRVRGNVLYIALLPENLRFDVFSPFGVTLSTLTADGEQFALFDLQEKRFWHGPAKACNVARFTHVPVPPFALVELMRGVAPVLVHEPQSARIGWDSDGYVIDIDSKHSARQRIVLEPHPDDWSRPYGEQRLRLKEVSVEQHGVELYRARLDDHAPASTAKPVVDPDHIEPDVPPSGPACNAELPGRIRLEVPGTDQDLLLVNQDLSHNPPIIAGAFRQAPRGGVQVHYADCP